MVREYCRMKTRTKIEKVELPRQWIKEKATAYVIESGIKGWMMEEDFNMQKIQTYVNLILEEIAPFSGDMR